jgi:hypothetical protein
MGTRALSLGVKLPGREADHSLPSIAEVKEYVELYLHSPSTPSWNGAQLKNTGIPLLCCSYFVTKSIVILTSDFTHYV